MPEFDEYGIEIKKKPTQQKVEVDEFNIPIKKKNSTQTSSTNVKTSSIGVETPLPTNTNSPSPYVEKPIDIEAMAVENGNPIDLSLTIHDNAASASGADDSGIESSKKLREATKKKFGVTDNDIDEIANDFKDFPKEAHDWKDNEGIPKYSKENLLALRNENKGAYQRTLASIKNQYAIRDGANEALANGTGKNSGISEANYFKNLNGYQNGNIKDLYDRVEKQKQKVYQFLPEDKQKAAIENMKMERLPFLSAANPDLISDYKQSEFKDILSPEQYAGLMTEKLFDPKLYEQAVSFLKTPIKQIYTHEIPTDAMQGFQSPVASSGQSSYENEDPKDGKLSQKTIDEQVAQEKMFRRLATQGRNNSIDNIDEKNANISNRIKQMPDSEEKNQLINQYNSNLAVRKSIYEDASKDDARYKLTANMKFDEQTKDILGEAPSLLNSALLRFAEQADNPRKAFQNLFGDSPSLQRQRLGESSDFEDATYLPDEYQKHNAPVTIVYPKEVREGIKAIDKDESLSFEQKRDAKRELLASNQSNIKTVTNPEAGTSKNFFSKATAYQMANFLGDVGGLMFTMAGNPVKGGAGEMMSMFVTSHNDFYSQAVKEGNTNPNEYANIHAGIVALAARYGSKLDYVKKVLGSKTETMLEGVTESTWKKVVEGNVSKISRLKDAFLDATKENAKQIGIWGGAVPAIHELTDNALYNKDVPLSDIASHSYQSMKDMTIGQLPFFGIHTFSNYNKVSNLQKSLIWESGDNSEMQKQRIKEKVESGELTPEQGKQQEATVKEIAGLIAQVPKENAKGKLTDEARADLLYNLYVKNKAKESKGVSPSGNEKADMAIAKLDMANDLILEPKTAKQLESLKSSLEKQLDEKDEQGKLILKEVQRVEVQGQLEAVAEQIEKNEKQGVALINVKEKTAIPDETIKPEAGKENKPSNITTEAEGKPIEPTGEGGEGTIPPKEEIIAGDGSSEDMTKMANAINDAHVEGKFGVAALDKVIAKMQDTSIKKIYESVKDKILKGTVNVKNVRERLITTKEGSEADQAVLMYDLANLKGKEKELTKEINVETDDAKVKILQKQLMEVQNEMMDNALANRSIGRTASTIFRLRQLWVNKEMDIADMMEDYKASNNLKELTPEQEQQIKTAHAAIREARVKLDLAKEELDIALDENAKLKVENERLETLKGKSSEQKKADRSKRSEEAIAKSKEREAKVKEDLKQLRQGLNDVTRVLPKTAIAIGKLAAEKVYQGVVKFDQLIKDILDDVKEIFPEWTENDVARHLLAKFDKDGNEIMPPNSQRYLDSKGLPNKPNANLKEKISAYEEAQKYVALKQFEWQRDRRTDMNKNMPMKDRIIDKVLRWQRFAVLSYPTTIVKLAAVVGHQLTLKPIKFGFQKLQSLVTPDSIKSKQSIWGDPKLSSLAKYYSAFIKNFALTNLKEQFKGIDTKELLYGRPMMYDEWNAAKGLLEIPGRSHGYIKSFIKNPEFAFAHEQQINFNLTKMAELQKKLDDPAITGKERADLKKEYDEHDVTNEDVMERINKLSLEHGKWGILMNENKFVDKFQKFTKDNGITGALIKSELPIVKIPLNFIGRAFATKYGLIKAITGSKWYGGNLPSMFSLIKNGTKDLTEGQANLLGQTLTLGSIGASFFALGYINRNNVEVNDDGSVDLFGVHISKNLTHSPEFESFFSGAETGAKYAKSNDKGTTEWLTSFVQSDIDIAKKNPFANMLTYGFVPQVATALLSKKDPDEITTKITTAVAKKFTDMGVPGFVKQPAQWLDTKEPELHPMGETTKRTPRGSNLEKAWETFELSIPLLRENVSPSGVSNKKGSHHKSSNKKNARH